MKKRFCGACFLKILQACLNDPDCFCSQAGKKGFCDKANEESNLQTKAIPNNHVKTEVMDQIRTLLCKATPPRTNPIRIPNCIIRIRCEKNFALTCDGTRWPIQ